MDQDDARELPALRPSDALPPHSTIVTQQPSGTVIPQAAAGTCPTCAQPQPESESWSQPLRLRHRPHPATLPPRSHSKRKAWQAIKRGQAAAKETDRQAMSRVLTDAANRYLVRQLCWVLSIHGIDTYILVPRDPADHDLLAWHIEPSPTPGDLGLVVGLRGHNAPSSMCNGLTLPIVIFDQIYPFDRKSLLDAIPKPKDAPPNFAAAAEEMFDRIMQQSDNAGATDPHRALNYLAASAAARSTATAATEFSRNASLTSIDVLPSPLSTTRRIVEVVFSFTSRDTDVVSKQFVRVDVTEEFPFLVTKLSPLLRPLAEALQLLGGPTKCRYLDSQPSTASTPRTLTINRTATVKPLLKARGQPITPREFSPHTASASKDAKSARFHFPAGSRALA